jgi:EAL domain-containing protein (putative c-di-GMP-specific phosphodiesterase class I)
MRTDGFELRYQPIVDRDGAVVALEALLRCHDEELGAIPAPELIATARSAGLMSELGRWVIETALDEVMCWRASGHEVAVAVNVDPEQLKDPTFVRRTRSMLDARGLPADALEVEVTEQGFVDDESGGRALRALRELGIRIAIDDFGTGYSALTYLMRLPISTVKLDRAFIQQIASDNANAAVVGHVIELAHALDLRVVAEGVEQDAAFKFLRARGCDLFQGYLFSTAVAADEVPGILDTPGAFQRAA